MKEISLEESRAIQLGILSEVDRYCNDNALTYYMSYGTLLGAVRHKGFIPWDDDIDIAMPYPDYEKFCLGYKGSQFKVNYWKLQPLFHCNYSKFEDLRTVVFEEIVDDYKIGINIDIAPIIGLPPNLNKAKIYFNGIIFYRNMLGLKKMKFRKGRSILKQLGLLLAKVPLAFVSYKMINEMIDKKCKKYPIEDSKYVICVGSFNPSKEIIEKEKMGIPMRLPFETGCFSAPSGYDAWLKRIFGDYMVLPPEEKRISRHTFKPYWREGFAQD